MHSHGQPRPALVESSATAKPDEDPLALCRELIEIAKAFLADLKALEESDRRWRIRLRWRREHPRGGIVERLIVRGVSAVVFKGMPFIALSREDWRMPVAGPRGVLP